MPGQPNPVEVARRGNLFEEVVQRDRPESRDIAIIGAPVNFGQEKPGVDMGPYAIRFPAEDHKEWLVTRLRKLGHIVDESGGEDIDIDKRFRGRVSPPSDAEAPTGYHREAVLSASQDLADKVNAALTEKRFPLVLGGDHSVGIGSIAGASGYYRKQGKKGSERESGETANWRGLQRLARSGTPGAMTQAREPTP